MDSSSSKMCIVYLPSSFFSPPNPINAPLVPEWLRGEDIESNGGPFVAHIQKQRCMAYYFWFGPWRVLWLEYIDQLSETFTIFRRTRVIALTPSQTLMSVAMLELPSMPRICLYPPLKRKERWQENPSNFQELHEFTNWFGRIRYLECNMKLVHQEGSIFQSVEIK